MIDLPSCGAYDLFLTNNKIAYTFGIYEKKCWCYNGKNVYKSK